jgi:4-amino-4-deoxy-L-arabinose transferase-like glycosyltransferase
MLKPSLVSFRRGYWIIFAATCIIGLAVTAISGDRLRYYDERDYNEIAQRLIETGSYTNAAGKPSAFRAPGYPVFLSLTYSVWNSPLAAKFVNVLALAIAGLLLGVLVERVFSGFGLIAGGMVAIYPLFLYTTSTLYPQILGLLLLSAGVLLLVTPKRDLRHVSGAGVIFGFLTLTISSFQLFLPIIAAWLAWQPPRAFARRSLTQGVVFLLVSIMIILPWTARNWQVWGSVVPVSTNGGLNLLLGNNENAGANTGTMTDVSHYRKEVATLSYNEVERDQFFRDAAVNWIRENPTEAMGLYIGKWFNHWNFSNQSKVLGETPAVGQILLFVSFYPLLAIALLRLCWWRKIPMTPTESLLYLLIIANAFISAMFFTRIRFRLPFDGLLIALAVIAIGQWREARRLSREQDFQLETER